MSAAGAVTRAAELVAPFGVTAVPDGPESAGWTPAGALADPAVLADLVGRRAAALGTADQRVAGTFLLEGWAWSLTAPAVAAALHEACVPDPSADAVRLAFAEDGTVAGVAFTGRVAVTGGHRLAATAGTVVVADLGAWLRSRLTDGHLGAVVEPLAPLAGRSPAALWASVHDMLSGALVHLAGAAAAPVDPRSLARTLFGTTPLRAAPRFVAARDARPVDRLRLGCCQMFRLGADRCPGCPGTAPPRPT